jgi:hypothetical protein
VNGRDPFRPVRGLSDEQTALLLAGRSREDDRLQSELAAFVRSTRQLYLEPVSPSVAERQEAAVVAAGRRLATEGPAGRPRGESATRSALRTLGRTLRPRPRRVAALAASILALAGAWIALDADGEPAPTLSDRQSPDRVPADAGRAERRPPSGEAGEGRPRKQAHEPRRGTTAGSPPVPAPDPEPALPAPVPAVPVEQDPGALAEVPAPDRPLAGDPESERPAVGGPEQRVELEGPVDTEPPAQGYGGPDRQPTPLKGPLDTEPRSAAPSTGGAAPEAPTGGKPTGEPDPTP